MYIQDMEHNVNYQHVTVNAILKQNIEKQRETVKMKNKETMVQMQLQYYSNNCNTTNEQSQ